MNELVCVEKRCEAQEKVFFGVEKRKRAESCIFYNALWRRETHAAAFNMFV